MEITPPYQQDTNHGTHIALFLALSKKPNNNQTVYPEEYPARLGPLVQTRR